MSFPKHAAYKEAQASWVREIPVTWEVARLGFEAETLVPMRDKPERLDGDIPWVRIEDFQGKYISKSKSGQGVSEETINSMNLKVFPVGTVLCSCSCSMGATAIAAAQIVSNQTFIGIVPGRGYKPEYLYYLLQASSEHLNSIGTGAIQSYLSRDDFRRLRLPKPPLTEQALASNFLDRETAKIDTLIAEQQRLIELLQEKRQAVISHAVTKGLNPNAPMKDSGVEWLGEVPEHWVVKKASWLFKTEKGKRAQELTQEFCAENQGPFPVFSGQTRDGGIMGVIDSYDFDAGEEGAILCTTVGAKAMSVRRITGKFSLSQNCMVISPKRIEAIPSFFDYGFQPLFKHERALIPDHMQPSFRMEDFNQLWIQVPPAE